MSRPGYGNTNGEAAMCPLFKAFTPNTIRCESHVPESQTIEIRYANTKNCEKQRQIYCEGNNWERCEHYLAWVHMKWLDEE